MWAPLFTSLAITAASWLAPNPVVEPPVDKSETTAIEWLSLEEAEKRSDKKGKPILVDFYTDWCGWCKKLDANTYSDPEVIAYVNEHFNPVKFNAESKDTFVFNGKEYAFKPSGGRGTNEFALTYAVRSGRLGYPTTSFITGDGKALTIVAGYHDAPNMLLLLRFVAEEKYLTTDFKTFQASERAAQLGE